VVGDFEGSNSVGIQGFYLQDLTGDGNPQLQMAFRLHRQLEPVSVGDVVRVTLRPRAL